MIHPCAQLVPAPLQTNAVQPFCSPPVPAYEKNNIKTMGTIWLELPSHSLIVAPCRHSSDYDLHYIYCPGRLSAHPSYNHHRQTDIQSNKLLQYENLIMPLVNSCTRFLFTTNSQAVIALACHATQNACLVMCNRYYETVVGSFSFWTLEGVYITCSSVYKQCICNCCLLYNEKVIPLPPHTFLVEC